ncbi:MAG: hypothetical protein BA871_08270 [Desulfuromonadales bacterium C00003096]|jgi:glycosyltransferase involved in cell wall biosynthesis|nr:MAG: hypothetical protein BA871_08270 [Desulfuromonadales bacterium C00003096]
MNRRKAKILFVRQYKSSFIQKDLELLKKHFEVRVMDFVLSRENLKGSLKTVFGMIKSILWADLTFSWFADTPAFWAVRLSKIFKKKSIVVVGGYEVAKVPEIGYGAMLNPKAARIVKYVLENADKVLAVSEFNKKEILKYTSQKNVELVYNGVDCDKFKPQGEKEDLVISVGYITDAVIKRKGFETFVKSALYLPNAKFVLIGKDIDDSIKYLKPLSPSNVEFAGFVSDEDLLGYYQRAKVYCQLSMYESFGMALAEAMSCRCVPVVANKAALPEIIGDTGFCVPYGDEKATAEAIKEALNSNNGEEAGERIKNIFPIERREEELVDVINRILEDEYLDLRKIHKKRGEK